MNKFLSFIGILVAALLIVGIIMGGLLFLLVWLPASEDPEKREQLACPEGWNSYMCLVKGYLRPEEPEEVWRGIIKE